MRLRIHGVVLACFLVVCLVGCGGPGGASIAQQQSQAQAMADQVDAARRALVDTQAALVQVKAQATAATQPVVIKPATDTQPAVTTAAPPEVVKAAAAIGGAADKAGTVVDKGAAITQVAAEAVAAYQAGLVKAQTEQQARDAAVQAALLAVKGTVQVAAPQYAPWVDLAYIGAGALMGLVGVLKGHSTAQLAITTPGTTLTQDGK